jgi:glycosyltransferase involved in cell wall biosynthesis
MKLIVQVPCFNEEATLPLVVRDIPRQVPGFDAVELLVVDDGSTDRTVEVARECGVDHVVRLTRNKGLVAAFTAGLDACLSRGADVIVNTDGDNQYCGADIPRLVEPILQGRADVVIGCRDIQGHPEFSFLKRRLQKLGSWAVRQISGTRVPDTTSGFRAYSRDAALRVNVVNRFTYTIETLIQAGKTRAAIVCVPVRTNRKTRESRLFRTTWTYIRRSVLTMFLVYTQYRPLKVFTRLGGFVFLAGGLLGVRFLAYYLMGHGAGRVQSLILAAVLMIIGFQTLVIGVLGDLIAGNRRLLEEALYRVRRLESESKGSEVSATPDVGRLEGEPPESEAAPVGPGRSAPAS